MKPKKPKKFKNELYVPIMIEVKALPDGGYELLNHEDIQRLLSDVVTMGCSLMTQDTVEATDKITIALPYRWRSLLPKT